VIKDGATKVSKLLSVNDRLKATEQDDDVRLSAMVKKLANRPKIVLPFFLCVRVCVFVSEVKVDNEKSVELNKATDYPRFTPQSPLTSSTVVFVDLQNRVQSTRPLFFELFRSVVKLPIKPRAVDDRRYSNARELNCSRFFGWQLT
jgi:hypothetical protein